MQYIGTSGLQQLGCNVLRASTLPHPTASGSRIGFQESCRSASSWSPITWVREALAPKMREQASEAELKAAREAAAEKGQLNVFETLPEVTESVSPRRKKYDHHKYSTGNFKISHRKLNLLGRQISGKPIDYALLQMQFSEKRASNRIKSMLSIAKDHAIAKGLQEQRLIVSEAWVTKGPHVLKRVDIKGRGRMGVKEHPHSKISVILREGKTQAEKAAEDRARKLRRIVSAGITREDVPIRNPGSAWAW